MEEDTETSIKDLGLQGTIRGKDFKWAAFCEGMK